MTTEKKLDSAFESASSENQTEIRQRLPDVFTSNVVRWKFGAYGWTSPVNLMITAAWYKWLNPAQDVCKIWGRDHNRKPIAGGFAIRSNDEKYTVPLVTKTGICQGFCSPNSGMQGSRAIEKMRSKGRIDRNTPIDQSVSFDMALFQKIINDINDLEESQALDAFKLFLRIGIDIKEKRRGERADLASVQTSNEVTDQKFLMFIKNISDPQFVKVACACMLHSVVNKVFGESELHGMGGSKTASDAQSKSAGDFWFTRKSDKLICGVEIKDKSKQIGFDILQAIENRKQNNSQMCHYIAVSAASVAVAESVTKDPYWDSRLNELRHSHDLNVLILDVNALLSLYLLNGGRVIELSAKISQELSKAIDLKFDTITKWADFVKNR